MEITTSINESSWLTEIRLKNDAKELDKFCFNCLIKFLENCAGWDKQKYSEDYSVEKIKKIVLENVRHCYRFMELYLSPQTSYSDLFLIKLENIIRLEGFNYETLIKNIQKIDPAGFGILYPYIKEMISRVRTWLVLSPEEISEYNEKHYLVVMRNIKIETEVYSVIQRSADITEKKLNDRLVECGQIIMNLQKKLEKYEAIPIEENEEEKKEHNNTLVSMLIGTGVGIFGTLLYVFKFK